MRRLAAWAMIIVGDLTSATLAIDSLDAADRDRILAVAQEIAEAHGDDYRPRGYRSDSPAYFIAIAAGFLLLLVGTARLQAARRHRPEPH